MGDRVFFGDNVGTVWLFGESSVDNGQPIKAQVMGAYALGGPASQDQRLKRVLMARAYAIGPAGFRPTVQLFFDYDVPLSISPSTLTAVGSATGGGTAWDAGFWDTATWGGTQVPSVSWQAVRGAGITVAVALSVLTSEEITFNGCDLLYEPGGLVSP
jgi:hypothetical protein